MWSIFRLQFQVKAESLFQDNLSDAVSILQPIQGVSQIEILKLLEPRPPFCHVYLHRSPMDIWHVVLSACPTGCHKGHCTCLYSGQVCLAFDQCWFSTNELFLKRVIAELGYFMMTIIYALSTMPQFITQQRLYSWYSESSGQVHKVITTILGSL